LLLKFQASKKAKAATVSVAARMDFESTEDFRSLLQIVQMNLVRRARYCAPIAERKCEAAEVGSHLEIYDITLHLRGATAPLQRVITPKIPGQLEILFSNPTHSLRRQICVGWKDTPMKLKTQVTLAVFALAFLMALMPAPAFASRNTGVARMHTETIHDRTPTVHEHSSHTHRG
jgi:hypothetical protein